MLIGICAGPVAGARCTVACPSLADGRLDALALCHGVRHEVVCTLSALKANDPEQKPVVCRLQLIEVLLAEGPPYAPVQQGFHHLGL